MTDSEETNQIHAHRRRGRGSGSNQSGRYETHSYNQIDDGWDVFADLPALKTSVQEEQAKSIITKNQSPDISFDRSINPYRGCEHGCSYCYARPTHAYMGLSPGLDFETKLFAKPNAAELLEKELAKPGYEPRMIALGTNTDPYQIIERDYQLTRQILQVLDRTNHPVGIVTKSALVTRDIDILGPMAERGLAKVFLSITSLDHKLSRAMEPRASGPQKRLSALKLLHEAGIPTGTMIAPVIPSLNDHEIENILQSVAEIGGRQAGYVLLRLPLEVAPLFAEWLQEHFPDRAERVLSLTRSMRGGKTYDSDWQQRMTGRGPYAAQISKRFKLALKRFGFEAEKRHDLRTDLFTPPILQGGQMSLF